MIYIQEKEFSRQIKLFSLLSDIDDFSICAWLYPGSNAISVAGQGIERSRLEPITSYGNGIEPFNTRPIECNKRMLSTLKAAREEIVANCDSLALYRPNSAKWFAATVGHESVCLVRDDGLLNHLMASGFSASTEAPAWW